MKQKFNLKEYLYITVAMAIASAAVYFLMLPGHIVIGSLSGLVLVLSNFIPLSISTMTFILNVILLIIGFIFIGSDFGVKTVYTSILLPVYLRIFEIIFPNPPSLTNDIVLDSLCYVLVSSIGLAMLFNTNASSGGLDIIAKLLNKYLHMDLGKAMTAAGMATAISSILVYDTKTLVLSILATYFNGIVLDHYVDGFHMRKRVCILSDKYETIQRYIMNDLERGVTLYSARGGYDNSEKVEIITILTRQEYGTLMQFIHKTDENAFITVSTVNEVVGHFRNSKRH